MREIRAADVRPRKKKPAGREQADSSHCRMNPDLGPQACRRIVAEFDAAEAELGEVLRRKRPVRRTR